MGRVRIFLHVGDSVSEMTPLTKRWRVMTRGNERSVATRVEKKAEEAWPDKLSRLRRMEAARRAGKVLKFNSRGEWIEE